MTDRQLRCFLALYETLNFSVAARQLFLTQPTLSYQIRTLEEELGTPLFVRTTCRVEPTQAGQLFAEFAQSTRKGYEAFQAALAAGQRQREKLVLQVPATMAARDPLYHDLLLALSRELPDCDLEVITDSTFRPPEEVLQSGVDALVQLLAEPVGSAVDVMSLFDTRCYLLASPNNPLSAESFLTPPQLTGQTVCFESCDAVFVSIVRRCMEEVPVLQSGAGAWLPERVVPCPHVPLPAHAHLPVHPPGRHPARDPDTKGPCSRRARPCRGGRQVVNGKYRRSTAAQYDFAAIIERAQPLLRIGYRQQKSVLRYLRTLGGCGGRI